VSSHHHLIILEDWREAMRRVHKLIPHIHLDKTTNQSVKERRRRRRTGAPHQTTHFLLVTVVRRNTIPYKTIGMKRNNIFWERNVILR
jgi:hypothetical protein